LIGNLQNIHPRGIGVKKFLDENVGMNANCFSRKKSIGFSCKN